MPTASPSGSEKRVRRWFRGNGILLNDDRPVVRLRSCQPTRHIWDVRCFDPEIMSGKLTPILRKIRGFRRGKKPSCRPPSCADKDRARPPEANPRIEALTRIQAFSSRDCLKPVVGSSTARFPLASGIRSPGAVQRQAWEARALQRQSWEPRVRPIESPRVHAWAAPPK